MSSSTSSLHFDFEHDWQAEILAARPLILPARPLVYPARAEEVERGALEVLVRPQGNAGAFLATCALGFADPAAPTGVWTCPNPDELCAVAGGYAYLISTREPERFTFLPLRPVLEVRAAVEAGLLLFAGHRTVVAWGRGGLAWETEKLSDEGLTILAVECGILRGTGWQMTTDKEAPFAVELASGRRIG